MTRWSTVMIPASRFRSIRFDPERGFFLNGKPIKLLGTANHQDHAGVGSGIPDALNHWRVAQLKEMGSNAWRSAHNPPATALLDACDEMGMLMIVEQRINSSSDEALSAGSIGRSAVTAITHASSCGRSAMKSRTRQLREARELTK